MTSLRRAAAVLAILAASRDAWRSVMTSLRRAAAVLAILAASRDAQAVEVGDAVCITGYIMDRYCIENTGGFLLDSPGTRTLQQPEEHSYHCLLDVGLCSRSGFVVLGPKDPEIDRHCLGFRIDDSDKVLAAGRAAGQKGYCSTCTGDDDAPEYGYRATVKGVVEALGDGSEGVGGTPILRDVDMLDAGVGCGEAESIPPLCARQLPTTPDPTPVPTPAPVATETGAPVAGNGGSALSCPESLDESIVIDAKATLYYALVPSDPPDAANGVFCARLEVENDGWVGVAFSDTGGMAGSTGIIGVEGTVRKYDLVAYGVTEAPAERQTLMDASIVQDGDTTILTFAKLLEEDGDVPIVEGANTLLHARGGASLSYHGGADRFVFEMDLGAAAAATGSPTGTPTAMPVTVSPTMKPTLSPVTESPSVPPVSESPTGKPSSSPVTASPTMKPSLAPVAESPVMTPSLSPVTESPVMMPSLSPVTESPVMEPSLSPVTESPVPNPATESPVMAPTGSPMVAATGSPTGTPSAAPATSGPTDEPTAPPASGAPSTNQTETASPTPSPFAYNLFFPPTPPPSTSSSAPTAGLQTNPAEGVPGPSSSASGKSFPIGVALSLVALFWLG